MDFAGLLKYAAPLGGGVALALMALAFGTWVLRGRYRERLEAIRRARPEDLPTVIGDEVQALGIASEGLTKEQRHKHVMLVLRQRESRNRRAFVLALVVAGLLAGITLVDIGGGHFRTAVPAATDSVCASTYLRLQVDIDGVLNGEGHDQSDGRYANARFFSFTLGNPTQLCTAIVSAIDLEVLEVVEDAVGPPEATTASYEYEVAIVPETRGLVPITKKTFDYPPRSHPEAFRVNVKPSVFGFDWVVRFVVRWRDLATGKDLITRTPTMLAAFPAKGSSFGGPSSSKLLKGREDLLASMRAKYDGLPGTTGSEEGR